MPSVYTPRQFFHNKTAVGDNAIFKLITQFIDLLSQEISPQSYVIQKHENKGETLFVFTPFENMGRGFLLIKRASEAQITVNIPHEGRDDERFGAPDTPEGRKQIFQAALNELNTIPPAQKS